MRICPACSREYADERTRCADDGVALVALSLRGKRKAEELLGRVIDGRYRVERILGRGGMGTVYACQHVVVGKAVALKVIQATERGDNALQRFVREAQTANSIRSRHIVETFDFGQIDDVGFYVVMELLDGIDLTRALRQGLLDHAALTHVFVQVAETLHLAHVQGVVHRDLKPDNIFLVREGDDPFFAKLLDFGIAKTMHAGPSGLTETGVILGTPYYMSPEQARGEQVDHRSDVYSLGVLMYRAYTGKLPFVADSTMGVLTRHITDAPEPPSRIRDVPRPLENVILRCLEKPREQRFQTAAEVAAALCSVSLGLGRTQDPPTPVESSGPRAARTPGLETLQRQALGSVPPPPSYSGPHTPHPHHASAETTARSAVHSYPQAHGQSAPEAGPSSSPPAGEQPTSRALVTSSVPAKPERTGVNGFVLVFGALAMAGFGAIAAFGMFGRREVVMPPSGTSDPSVVAPAAPPAVEVPAALPVPVSAPPVASASSAPAAPSSAPSATAVAKQQPKAPKPPPAPIVTAEPAPAASVKKPQSEVRSPFE